MRDFSLSNIKRAISLYVMQVLRRLGCKVCPLSIKREIYLSIRWEIKVRPLSLSNTRFLSIKWEIPRCQTRGFFPWIKRAVCPYESQVVWRLGCKVCSLYETRGFSLSNARFIS